MGFYINHLKSAAARRYAGTIERQVADHTGDSTVIKVSFPNISSKTLSDLHAAATAAYLDHPEWFHISREFRYVQSLFTVTVAIRLMYTADRARTLSQQVDDISRHILGSFPSDTDSWQRELIIYQYLQDSVTYSTDDGECYSIIGALINHRACCEGVSKAFAILCHKAGINCITVMDDVHMWNIVQMNGITAQVDITPGLSGDGFNYAYFNVTDEDIAANHGKAILCVPRCADHSLSFYAVKHTLFKNEGDLTKYIIRNYCDGKRPVPVKLLNGSIPDAVRRALIVLPFQPTLTYSEMTNTAEIYL